MFITFEGLDASGKSSTLKLLNDYIKNKYPKIQTITTREPGGANNVEAEKIRQIILDKTSVLSDWSEALLYSTSRRIHLERVVWPNLEAKKLVLCDRYTDSFYAYQGFGRRLGIKKVEELTNLITDNTIPDITIYFKISVEKSIERKTSTRDDFDRLDSQSDDFYTRVKEGYDFLIRRDATRFIIIDAEKDLNTVFNELVEKLFVNKKFVEYINEHI